MEKLPDYQEPKKIQFDVLPLLWAGLALGLLYAAYTMAVRHFEVSLLFQPSRYPKGDWEMPKKAPEDVQELEIVTEDDVALFAWLVRPKAASAGTKPRPKPSSRPKGKKPKKAIPRFLLIYFHGNAGSLAERFFWIQALVETGVDVLAVDYRGYGKSEGSPSEEGLQLDAEAVYSYAIETLEVPPERILLYGKSLGGAVAAQLASTQPVRGLILQSTFSTLADQAEAVFPNLPTRGYLTQRFDTLEALSYVQCPTLVIHSRDDHLIPFRLGEMVFAHAPEPKQFAEFTGSDHNDLIVRERQGVLQAIRRLLRLAAEHELRPPLEDPRLPEDGTPEPESDPEAEGDPEAPTESELAPEQDSRDPAASETQPEDPGAPDHE